MQVRANLNKASPASLSQEPLEAPCKACGLLLAVAIVGVRVASTGQWQGFRVTQPKVLHICLYYLLCGYESLLGEVLKAAEPCKWAYVETCHSICDCPCHYVDTWKSCCVLFCAGSLNTQVWPMFVLENMALAQLLMIWHLAMLCTHSWKVGRSIDWWRRAAQE